MITYSRTENACKRSYRTVSNQRMRIPGSLMSAIAHNALLFSTIWCAFCASTESTPVRVCFAVQHTCCRCNQEAALTHYPQYFCRVSRVQICVLPPSCCMHAETPSEHLTKASHFTLEQCTAQCFGLDLLNPDFSSLAEEIRRRYDGRCGQHHEKTFSVAYAGPYRKYAA